MSNYRGKKVFVINEVKNPKVSVIVPTLNEEKYIGYTLRTPRNQDYKEKYEIIVVESNSRDKTIKIAKMFADKVIITERKGFLSEETWVPGMLKVRYYFSSTPIRCSYQTLSQQ